MLRLHFPLGAKRERGHYIANIVGTMADSASSLAAAEQAFDNAAMEEKDAAIMAELGIDPNKKPKGLRDFLGGMSVGKLMKKAKGTFLKQKDPSVRAVELNRSVCMSYDSSTFNEAMAPATDLRLLVDQQFGQADPRYTIARPM